MKKLIVLLVVLVLVCLIALPAVAANSASSPVGGGVKRPLPPPICQRMCPDTVLYCVPCPGY